MFSRRHAWQKMDDCFTGWVSREKTVLYEQQPLPNPFLLHCTRYPPPRTRSYPLPSPLYVRTVCCLFSSFYLLFFCFFRRQPQASVPGGELLPADCLIASGKEPVLLTVTSMDKLDALKVGVCHRTVSVAFRLSSWFAVVDYGDDAVDDVDVVVDVVSDFPSVVIVNSYIFPRCHVPS